MTKTADWPRINYCLYKNAAVFFVLSDQLRREQLRLLLDRLQERAGTVVGPEQEEKYWRVLAERMTGRLRWDKVVPLVWPTEGNIEEQVAFSLTQQNVPHIVQRLPYVPFTINSITYLIDVFNPRDELNVGYPGAGEPVVALQLYDVEWIVHDQLTGNPQFYSILKEFDDILSPRIIAGMNSSTLATWVSAYIEGRVSTDVSPWSFLFPLSVIRLSKPLGDVSVARYFKHVEHWSHGRVLLQTKNGLDNLLSRTYVDAANILGMRAIQELHPDM